MSESRENRFWSCIVKPNTPKPVQIPYSKYLTISNACITNCPMEWGNKPIRLSCRCLLHTLTPGTANVDPLLSDGRVIIATFIPGEIEHTVLCFRLTSNDGIIELQVNGGCVVNVSGYFSNLNIDEEEEEEDASEHHNDTPIFNFPLIIP